MANRWLQHLAQYRKVNKDMKPQDLMKNARKSYQNGGGVFKSIGNTAKSVSHDVKSSVHKLKGGGGMVTPYVKEMHSGPAGYPDPIGMRGGGFVPYSPTGTDSTPAVVGGRRSRRNRQSQRQSQRQSRKRQSSRRR
jgi:hypothetical protein